MWMTCACVQAADATLIYDGGVYVLPPPPKGDLHSLVQEPQGVRLTVVSWDPTPGFWFGVILALVGLVLVFGCTWFWHRRHLKKKRSGKIKKTSVLRAGQL